MGLRQNRLGDEVRDLIASCFLGGSMNDPALEGVTITYVKLSADLQVASVYYRLYDSSLEQEAKDGLYRCNGYLRQVLAKNLSLRRVPSLRFFYDKSVENGAKIENLLHNLKS